MTAIIDSVDLGAGPIYSARIVGLTVSEADFLKSLCDTVKRDQMELPQHSNHEVILDAAMKLCDQFGKDDPEYTTAAVRLAALSLQAVRLAALSLRIATEGEEAFDISRGRE